MPESVSVAPVKYFAAGEVLRLPQKQNRARYVLSLGRGNR
jgi:hypothetical protein